ncbi:MAG: NAD(+)/NADH kinase [Lachnospiraceae bacterium]|nr:NAD(+)/NADH kinase [Lachnospiraceae bacterium]
MKQFYIITNITKDEDYGFANQVAAFLKERGCTVVLRTDEITRVPAQTDCILVLGGDGTMLRAATDSLGSEVPLLGINLGNVGFLAEVAKDDYKEALLRVLDGNYETEERMMIDIDIMHETGETDCVHALNDIAVTRGADLKMKMYEVLINGKYVKTFYADGIVVSTPTGSTGYSMSAGGPIVEPGAKSLLLTPLCSHSLTSRSIVLDPADEIEIRIGKGHSGEEQEVAALYDGRNAGVLRSGSAIRVKRSEKVTRLIRLSKVSFLDILHRKLAD